MNRHVGVVLGGTFLAACGASLRVPFELVHRQTGERWAHLSEVYYCWVWKWSLQDQFTDHEPRVAWGHWLAPIVAIVVVGGLSAIALHIRAARQAAY